MAGNLPLNNSRKTTARLFAATFLCTVGTTLLSQWCFRFYEVTSGGLSPHSLFVAVASVLIVTAGPRLSAAFPPKYLASLGLIAIFASALTIASVPSWALAGSGATVIASAFLEVIVCRSLLTLPNSAMRKVFVAATVGGALIGSYFPIDTSVMLFVAPACITIASPFSKTAPHHGRPVPDPPYACDGESPSSPDRPLGSLCLLLWPT